MKNTTVSCVRRWLRSLAVLSVAATGMANAAVYSGIWDPPYGSPFTNLGWRGTATYFVPDTCLPGGTAIVDNATGCGGAATVTSAQVDFYDTTAGINAPTIATLIFNPSTLIIDDLSFVSGQLTDLSTSGSNYVDPTANLSAYNVGSATEFTLFFTLADGPRLGWRDCSYYPTTYSTYHYEPECSFGTNDNTQFPVTNFTITQVPEPGTLALASVALLGLVPRRMRKALMRRR